MTTEPKKRQTIADVAIEVLKENNAQYLGLPDFGITQEVWEECFKRGVVKDIGSRGGNLRSHPINKIQVVNQALSRDKRFSCFKILCCGSSLNGAERLTRVFKLKSN